MNEVYLPGVNESVIMQKDGFLSKPLQNMLNFIEEKCFDKVLEMISSDIEKLATKRRKQRTGKDSPGIGGQETMPVEVVLVFVMARAFYSRCYGDKGYAEMCESVSLRRSLAHYGYCHIPSRSTIHDNVTCLSEDTLELINSALLQKCASLGIDDFLYMVQDSTAIEADSAYPLDSALLKKLGNRTFRLLQKCIALCPQSKKVHTARLEYHLKRIGEIDFEINMLCSKERRKRRADEAKKKAKEAEQKAFAAAAEAEKTKQIEQESATIEPQLESLSAEGITDVTLADSAAQKDDQKPELQATIKTDLVKNNTASKATSTSDSSSKKKAKKKARKKAKSISGLRKERCKLYKTLLDHAAKAQVIFDKLETQIDIHSLDLSMSLVFSAAFMEFSDKIITVKRRFELIAKEDYGMFEPELILSVSDADAAFIEKGGREKIFGYRVNFARSEKGFITAAYVERGNNADSEVFMPTLKKVAKATGVIPETGSTDAGYCSGENLKQGKIFGVKHISFAGSKGKALHGEEEFNKEENIELRRKRSAIEADISHLKHDWNLLRFSVCGIKNVKKELLIRQFGYNSSLLARLIVEKEKAEAKAKAKREAQKMVIGL